MTELLELLFDWMFGEQGNLGETGVLTSRTAMNE